MYLLKGSLLLRLNEFTSAPIFSHQVYAWSDLILSSSCMLGSLFVMSSLCVLQSAPVKSMLLWLSSLRSLCMLQPGFTVLCDLPLTRLRVLWTALAKSMLALVSSNQVYGCFDLLLPSLCMCFKLLLLSQCGLWSLLLKSMHALISSCQVHACFNLLSGLWVL